MKIRVFAAIFFVGFVLSACLKPDPYNHYEQIKNHKWKKDKWLVYNFDSLSVDALQTYDVLLQIVNTNQYPYQNLWLRISQNIKDTLYVNDTLEVKLANPDGKWMGSGTTGLYQLSVPYLKNIRLEASRKYNINIKHIMRDDPLIGIDKIGVVVRKNEENLELSRN